MPDLRHLIALGFLLFNALVGLLVHFAIIIHVTELMLNQQMVKKMNEFYILLGLVF